MGVEPVNASPGHTLPKAGRLSIRLVEGQPPSSTATRPASLRARRG